jgi:TolA-binding protein
MKSIKIIILIIGTLILTFCNSNKEQELFKEGHQLESNSKFDEAIVKFQEVVNEYPTGKQADSSLFEIAKIYQGQVIKNLGSLESLRKSVETYKLIVKKYPESKLAESSLFMAAFILANELKDFPQAERMYKLYIQKYPEGTLVNDAKVELSNLGKSPEEILNNHNAQ